MSPRKGVPYRPRATGGRDYLRTLRVARGLTQADAAAAIGLSRPAYVALEQGVRGIDDVAAALASVFGVPVVDVRHGRAVTVTRVDRRCEAVRPQAACVRATAL